LALLKTSLFKLFKEEGTQSLPVSRIVEYVNTESPNDEFSRSEMNAGLEKMTQDNHIMIADDIVFLI
jgi:hypothetical protein